MAAPPDQGHQGPQGQPPLPPGGLTREQALAKVRPPAIALIVVAGIGIAMGLATIMFHLLGITVGTLEGADDPGMWVNAVGGGFGILQSVVGIAIGVLIIFGAMRMMELQGWGLALASAIIAMVPCVSPCCVLGLPFGIWALVVLADSQVKVHFQ